MIDITLYSAEKIEYELDIDVRQDKSGHSSLFINHIDNTETTDRNKIRLFLTSEQLHALRDLLNEKLPPPQFEELAKLKQEQFNSDIEAMHPQGSHDLES